MAEYTTKSKFRALGYFYKATLNTTELLNCPDIEYIGEAGE